QEFLKDILLAGIFVDKQLATTRSRENNARRAKFQKLSHLLPKLPSVAAPQIDPEVLATGTLQEISRLAVDHYRKSSHALIASVLDALDKMVDRRVVGLAEFVSHNACRYYFAHSYGPLQESGPTHSKAPDQVVAPTVEACMYLHELLNARSSPL